MKKEDYHFVNQSIKIELSNGQCYAEFVSGAGNEIDQASKYNLWKTTYKGLINIGSAIEFVPLSNRIRPYSFSIFDTDDKILAILPYNPFTCIFKNK